MADVLKNGAFHFSSLEMFVSTNHVAGGWDLSARNWLLTAKNNSASRCQVKKIDPVNFATMEIHLKDTGRLYPLRLIQLLGVEYLCPISGSEMDLVKSFSYGRIYCTSDVL